AGILSGTPTASGTFPITFTASNGVLPNAVQSFTLTVNQAPTITSASSTTFTEGVAGSFTVTATGFPTPSITESGALPGGVKFNAGILSGTPTVLGTFPIAFTASNGVSPNAVQSFTLTVNQARAITMPGGRTFPEGWVGSFTVTATGSPTPSITESGALPGGMTFTAGILSGTASASGTFPITFTASNGVLPNAVQNFTLTVSPTQAPVITSASSTTFTEGVAGSFTVTATGSPTPSITESGALPGGMTFTAGILSGTPTALGTFLITFTASNGISPNAVQSFTLTINQAPVITRASSTTFTEGATGSFTVTATGSPTPSITESGALPGGVTFNAGILGGTPTASGTSPITFTASNGVLPNAVHNFTLAVSPTQAPAITSASSTTFTEGVAGSFTVTATGSPTPSITESGALPGGVTFIAGILSGTPSASGTFPITFTASNGVSPNAVQNFTLTVNNPAPVYTVSGTVTYTGSYSGSTDWIYLELNSNNCNGCGGSNLGTSIRATTLKSGGAFTIHGVQPGTYTLQAYLDNLGYGAENASNPTGSIGNVTVTNVGVSVGSVALTDPGTVTLSSAPTWKNTKGSGTFSGGAFISYQSIQNNNGIEMAASYTVEWSTSSTFATIAGNKSFPATGGSDTKI